MKKLKLSQLAALTGISPDTLHARVKQKFGLGVIEKGPGNKLLLSPDEITKLLETEIYFHNGCIIIFVCLYKGGVGKTTISYLLSLILSAIGFKVCMVDTCMQGNLTTRFLPKNVDIPVLYDVLTGAVKIEDAIIKIDDNLSLLPSNFQNNLIATFFSGAKLEDPKTWFKSLCLDYLRGAYGVVVVDTPPDLNMLSSVWGLCLEENDRLLIPAEADDFSPDGIDMLLTNLFAFRKEFNINYEPKISILINKFEQELGKIVMCSAIAEKHSKYMLDYVLNKAALIHKIVHTRTELGDVRESKKVFEMLGELLLQLGVLRNCNPRIKEE